MLPGPLLCAAFHAHHDTFCSIISEREGSCNVRRSLYDREAIVRLSNRRSIARGKQRYRGGGCRRRRGWHCRVPAAQRGGDRLPADRSARAAWRTGVDDRRRPASSRSIWAAAGCIRPIAIRGARLPRRKAARSTRRRRPGRALRLPIGFPLAEQARLLEALRGILCAASPRRRRTSRTLRPRPCSIRDGRWNNLIGAVGTYVSGAELERVSARDFARYDDSGVNWRVVEGYGATIAAHGADLPVVLGCPVRRIDHSGRRLRVETADGTIAADAAIVTLPSALLAEERLCSPRPCPRRPRRRRACRSGLPTSCSCRSSDAEEFEKDSRLFGRTDRSGTATYHVRPFGRPQIEAYFGGDAWPRSSRPAGEACVPRFCRRRTGRPARQRLRPPGEAASPASLGHRSVRRAAHTPTPCRARRIAARRSPRRWTIACSSPARRARPTISRPRTAPISPASPPPTRRSPRGAAGGRDECTA